MPRRKRLVHDAKRRAEIKAIVGRQQVAWRHADYVAWVHWNRRTHPKRDFAERVYAAILFIRDMRIACQISERSETIEEAAQEAKAMVALKEIANAQA